MLISLYAKVCWKGLSVTNKEMTFIFGFDFCLELEKSFAKFVEYLK